MRTTVDALHPCLVPDLQSADLPGEPLRHVLRRPGFRSACVRLDEQAAGLVMGLDGSRTIEAVVADARQRLGADGPALLVRLLAELGERGFVSGVAAADTVARPALGPLSRLLRPRAWQWRRAPAAIDGIYRCGGWLLVTPVAAILFALVGLAGLAALVLLLLRGAVTPFVVGGRLGLGAACFLGGRAALVFVHELLHGLALRRTGHRIAGAGIKLLAIFPYAYVDTSPAWLEPRRRRMMVTAAGPASDLVLGGAAAIAARLTHGVASAVSFQLALAGYLAALLNLNPCLERDGYHLLCDAIRRPGLRAAAIADLQSRLSGRGAAGGRPLRWFAGAIVVWGVAGAALAVASLSGELPRWHAALPHDVSLGLLLILWAVLLAPTGLLVGRPLVSRPAPGRRATSARRGAGARTAHGIPGRSARLTGVRADPLGLLARQVLSDASLRQRVCALGAPPGFEPLGDRELKSSIAGVVLAAGGESLALAHTGAVLAPKVEHLADHAIADTNVSQLRSLLGLDHPATMVQPHLEPELQATPHSPTEPILYEPPTHHGHRAATSSAVSADPVAAAGPVAIDGTLPAWPGNDAGQVAIAHWMATGAESAGLPGPLPVMAALVESNLNNNACCDHDSLGYFQMREATWNIPPWTGYFQNPELQLQWFIHQALEVRDEMRAGGDPGFGNDPSGWGSWIAAIENPAAQYRYRYQLQLENAEALLNQPLQLPGATTVFEPTTGAGSVESTGAGDSDGDGELVNTPSGQGFRSLLNQLFAASSSRSANPSGYVEPFSLAEATMGRTDQGVDADLGTGDPIDAIGPSQVVGITPDWYDGEPYVWMQLTSGPEAGQYYYLAEQIHPSVTVGETLAAGQPIATYAASGTGIEIGWATADGSTLARAMAHGLDTGTAQDTAALHPTLGVPGTTTGGTTPGAGTTTGVPTTSIEATGTSTDPQTFDATPTPGAPSATDDAASVGATSGDGTTGATGTTGVAGLATTSTGTGPGEPGFVAAGATPSGSGLTAAGEPGYHAR